jgi:hypothetical protein
VMRREVFPQARVGELEAGVMQKRTKCDKESVNLSVMWVCWDAEGSLHYIFLHMLSLESEEGCGNKA